tara:strand:- start:380 stop:967 length:588 start_codon:yes stop_codon:yes gene_type:complete
MKTKNNNTSSYHNYLKNRSKLGGIYREFFLYPRINKLLKGDMLDIGCGLGDMIQYRANSVGCDINPLNIEYCKKRGLDAFVMGYNKPPFKNNSFDSILLDNVIEHIVDPDPLLKSVKRLLKKDGFIVVGVPGVKGYQHDHDHKCFYNEQKIEQLALKHGYRVANAFYSPVGKSVFLSNNLSQYCYYSQWTLNISR